MRRFFCSRPIENNFFILDGSEHNHLKNVLRLSLADKVVIFCGDEYDYVSEISDIKKDKTLCKLLEKKPNTKNPQVSVTLFQSLIKKDNMNLIVQKLNELGVDSLVPVVFKNTVVKGSENKTAKLTEIAIASCKQCERSVPIMVFDAVNFKEMQKQLIAFEQIVFANERQDGAKLLATLQLKRSKKTAVIIGPEGGFDQNEISQLLALKNVQSVSLGKRILRSETAAIVLSAIVLTQLEEI